MGETYPNLKLYSHLRVENIPKLESILFVMGVRTILGQNFTFILEYILFLPRMTIALYNLNLYIGGPVKLQQINDENLHII